MMAPPNTLPVLTLLGEHHEFMERLSSIAVMEDADGHDSAWWADYQFDPNDPKTKAKINSIEKPNDQIIYISTSNMIQCYSMDSLFKPDSQMLLANAIPFQGAMRSIFSIKLMRG